MSVGALRTKNVFQQGAPWAAGAAAVSLFIVLLAGAWQFWLLRGSLDRQAALVNAAVIERDRLLQLVNEETGVRGYVATGNPLFLQIYNESVPQEIADVAKIDDSFAVVPSLRPGIADLQGLGNRVRRYFAHEIRLVQSGDLGRARANLEAGKSLFDALRRADVRAELQVDAQLGTQRRQTRVLAQAGFAAALIVCGALAFFGAAFLLLLQRARAYRLTTLRDALTGVGNRLGANAAIESLIRSSDCEMFGLVFIDLDGFKKVNDAYGHAAGDAILKAVGSRLCDELREADEVCRLGGDEFVCVIAPPTSQDQMHRIATRLQKAVTRPYAYGRDSYVIGCSVGVSIYPQHGTKADVLLEGADRAMYRAKIAGGGVRVAFAP